MQYFAPVLENTFTKRHTATASWIFFAHALLIFGRMRLPARMAAWLGTGFQHPPTPATQQGQKSCRRKHMDRLVQFKAHHVAVLPQRKLVQMARIGKPDPVACLRSVWSTLGLSWDRWALFVQARCDAAGLQTLQGKDQQGRRSVLLTWHKVPELLTLVWEDLQAYAKPAATTLAAKLIGQWPDKRRLAGSRQLMTRGKVLSHTLAPKAGSDALAALNSSAEKAARVLASKPGRIQILRAVHEPEVLRLKGQGFNTVQIGKRMGISRSAVSQIINGSYPYKHD